MGVQSTIGLLSPVTLGLVAALAGVVLALFVLARWGIGPAAENARRWGLVVLRATVVLLLLAILANPVRVDELPGSIERPNVFYLLDTSASMALGDGTSRFQKAIGTIQEVHRLVPPDLQPQLGAYRFGRELAAVESLNPDRELSTMVPTDPDTQLLAALRQLTGRFSRSPPQAVVLFSDGRVREPAGVQEMALRYARMKMPIHVMPLGSADRSGDVAVLNIVVPAAVRKHSQVDVWGWLRSYGYDEKRTEVQLSAIDTHGNVTRQLDRQPITLGNGIQPFGLKFQSDLQSTRLQVAVPLQPDEVSADNNKATAEVTVDRTKIRVLYVEGTMESFVQPMEGGRRVIRGAHSYLVDALSEDSDVECLVLTALPGGGRLRQVTAVEGFGKFPDSRAALFAFDAIVLSNVAKAAFREQELQWIEEWISQRGGGLCMIGGPQSFSAGGWSDGLAEKILPVVWGPGRNNWNAARVTIRPVRSSSLHPIWNIVSDEKQNRAILESLPDFRGSNRLLRAKPGASVIAVADSVRSQQGPAPVIVVAPYGKGRTLAMAAGITRPLAPEFVQKWGVADNRYYAKFWRNVVYWLAENSVNGRRRLVASSDKISYRPGERIRLQAAAYDEGANRTTGCRVGVIIEPQSAAADLESDYSPVHWPEGVQRTSGEEGPYIAWGEEFEMVQQTDGQDYAVELPLVDAGSPAAATQAIRIELSAYEDYALIDSTSIDVQILDDPFEHRNPLPDRELLGRIASLSGGSVLPDATALAGMLEDLDREAGPPTLRNVPLWSRWWLLVLLLMLLTIEWGWRRILGMA